MEKIETAEHKLRVTATKDDHDIIEDYDTVSNSTLNVFNDKPRHSVIVIAN